MRAGQARLVSKQPMEVSAMAEVRDLVRRLAILMAALGRALGA